MSNAAYLTIQDTSVPALGLGTWRMWGDEAQTAVEHALDLGYRHIDTAQMYDNETAVAQALTASPVDRAEIFLTTKLWFTNLSYRDVLRTTEESLRRLQTEYVDLLLIHWPNEVIPLAETFDGLLQLQAKGKTRHIGVSNFTPALIEEAVHLGPLFCNQVEYHPYLSQRELLDLAEEHDFMLTAYSPIAKGRVLNNPTLQRIAEQHGKSPIQVTLRWLIQQGQVAAVPKAARAEHRAHNFDIFDFVLSPDEMKSISSLDEQKRLVNPDWAPW